MREHPGIALPPGRRVYAIGDMHGRRDLILALFETIRRDIQARPPDSACIVCLGDYVDRGPASRDVVDLLIAPPVDGAAFVCLKGNHEQFMMRFAEAGDHAVDWVSNGGRETMLSYGVDDAEDAIWDAARIAGNFRDAIPDAHWSFFENLPHSHRDGSLFFAHAGVDPNRALDDQQAHDLMWIREGFLDCTRDLGAVVVHGHTPVPAPEVTNNRINVDTGAWFSGRLTAAVLEDGGYRFLST